MKFSVKVTPNAREERVDQLDDAHLTGHFNVPPSSIRIVSGRTSRNKVVDVPVP